MALFSERAARSVDRSSRTTSVSTRTRETPLRAWSTALGVALTLSTLALTACGAKTGLRIPDATADVPLDAPADVFMRFDACVPGRFPLVRRNAEALFVIDRSGSMSQALEPDAPPEDGGLVLTRWRALREALTEVLPPVDRQLMLGALYFPRVPIRMPLSLSEACTVEPRLDIAPAFGTADAIVDVMRRTEPRGATPTYSALRVAGSILRAHTERERARYLVVGTDGGPNCNESLDPATCLCIDPVACMDEPAQARFYCLDTDRTEDLVREYAREGIFTYVIGLDDPTEPRLTAALDRLAVAGGRANPVGETRYYSVRRRDELLRAFRDVARTITQCAYVTPSRPDDPDDIDVELGGTLIRRDPRHENGWDWTDRDYGELTLYGPFCDRALASEAPLRARVGCRDS